MLKRLIRSIRKQPKGTRDSIAMGIAVSFTAVVFIVWGYHMPARMSSITEKSADDETPSFSQLFFDFKNQATVIKTSVNEVVETNGTLVDSELSEQSNDVSETGTSSVWYQISDTASSTLGQSTSTSVADFATSSQFVSSSSRSIRIVTATSSPSNTATTAKNE
jgi:hypothetical protein